VFQYIDPGSSLNPGQTIPCLIVEFYARSRERATRITTCFFRLIKTYPQIEHVKQSSYEPITPPLYLALSKIKVDRALELTIPYYHIEAQDTLGSANVRIDDLLLLPEYTENSPATRLYTVGSVTRFVLGEQCAHRPGVIQYVGSAPAAQLGRIQRWQV